jgi:hypothetical protein
LTQSWPSPSRTGAEPSKGPTSFRGTVALSHHFCVTTGAGAAAAGQRAAPPPPECCVAQDFVFDELVLAKPSRMKPFYVMFSACVLGVDMMYAMWAIPSIATCRLDQTEAACRVLGLPTSALAGRAAALWPGIQPPVPAGGAGRAQAAAAGAARGRGLGGAQLLEGHAQGLQQAAYEQLCQQPEAPEHAPPARAASTPVMWSSSTASCGSGLSGAAAPGCAWPPPAPSAGRQGSSLGHGAWPGSGGGAAVPEGRLQSMSTLLNQPDDSAVAHTAAEDTRRRCGAAQQVAAMQQRLLAAQHQALGGQQQEDDDLLGDWLDRMIEEEDEGAGAAAAASQPSHDLRAWSAPPGWPLAAAAPPQVRPPPAQPVSHELMQQQMAQLLQHKQQQQQRQQMLLRQQQVAAAWPQPAALEWLQPQASAWLPQPQPQPPPSPQQQQQQQQQTTTTTTTTTATLGVTHTLPPQSACGAVCPKQQGGQQSQLHRLPSTPVSCSQDASDSAAFTLAASCGGHTPTPAAASPDGSDSTGGAASRGPGAQAPGAARPHTHEALRQLLQRSYGQLGFSRGLSEADLAALEEEANACTSGAAFGATAAAAAHAQAGGSAALLAPSSCGAREPAAAAGWAVFLERWTQTLALLRLVHKVGGGRCRSAPPCQAGPAWARWGGRGKGHSEALVPWAPATGGHGRCLALARAPCRPAGARRRPPRTRHPEPSSFCAWAPSPLCRSLQLWDTTRPTVIAGVRVPRAAAAAALRGQPAGTFLCRVSGSEPGTLIVTARVGAAHPNADADGLAHVALPTALLRQRRADSWLRALPHATHALDAASGARVDKRKLLEPDYVSVAAVAAATGAGAAAAAP